MLRKQGALNSRAPVQGGPQSQEGPIAAHAQSTTTMLSRRFSFHWLSRFDKSVTRRYGSQMGRTDREVYLYDAVFFQTFVHVRFFTLKSIDKMTDK